MSMPAPEPAPLALPAPNNPWRVGIELGWTYNAIPDHLLHGDRLFLDRRRLLGLQVENAYQVLCADVDLAVINGVHALGLIGFVVVGLVDNVIDRLRVFTVLGDI